MRLGVVTRTAIKWETVWRAGGRAQRRVRRRLPYGSDKSTMILAYLVLPERQETFCERDCVRAAYVSLARSKKFANFLERPMKNTLPISSRVPVNHSLNYLGRNFVNSNQRQRDSSERAWASLVNGCV